MNSAEGTESVCRFCNKPIGYGLGIFKKKWYHAYAGDSDSCPGPIYPLPMKAKKAAKS